MPVAEATAAVTEVPVAEATAEAAGEAAGESGEETAVNWWEDAVFYEVFLRSFADSDGDGIGDISGLIERLDYLNDGDPATTDDLGVTGIWLMPPMQSPSYHGYDVVDYYTIEEEYGTNEDFQRLMEEAHARGIRVIVDLVLNHTSVEHPWFEAAVADVEAPTRDYYLWAAEEPRMIGPFGQPVWHESPTGYYYGLFWGGMPDLNYRNEQVTEEMHGVARYWLEEMGADGFRLDAVKYLVENEGLLEGQPETHEWLQGFYEVMKEANGEAFAIGEVWSPTFQVLKYVGDELDAAFEFDLAKAIMEGVNGRNAAGIGRAMANSVERFPPGGFGTFLTNHDQNRVMWTFAGDEGKARLAAAILLTSPGVPFVYYGEEIGQSGSKPDEDIRLPLQWSDGPGAGFTTGEPWRAPAEDYAERTIAAQQGDAGSLWSAYRDLIALRNGHAALRTGAWTLVETNARGAYAFLRHDEEEALLVVLNLDDEPLEGLELSLAEGPLAGVETAVTLWGEEGAAAPVVTATGGFEGYVPFGSLAGESGAVLRLE